jgi:polar amino acid transport system substrate-binding protein
MEKMKKLLSVLVLIVIIAGALTGCSDEKKPSFQSMEDFENAKIGIMLGSSFDVLAKEYLPGAERCYYESLTDLFLTLRQNKVDGILLDKAFYTAARWENDDLSYIEMEMPQTQYAAAFPQSGTELKAQMDEFIQKQTENGWLESLENKWFSENEPTIQAMDFSKLSGENGVLRVATESESIPFSYLKEEGFCGFDFDFIYKFAMEYGYSLDIQSVSFPAILPGLKTEKYDIALCGITVTEERKESVLFSEPYYTSPIVMTVIGNHSDNSKKVLSDFENAKIGVLTGTVYDDYAKNLFPNAERKYFNLLTDVIMAVESGKIDGYLAENTYVSAALWEGAKIDTVDEAIDHTEAGFIFQKGSDSSATVREQLNTFLNDAKANGLLDQLYKKWIGKTEPTEFFDHDSLSGENGTLKVAVSPDLKPLCYIKNGDVAGYEVEVLQHFAMEYGYNLEFHTMAFDAILPGVVSGRYDIGCGGMTITEERAESVDFSESYLTVDIVMVISDAAAGQSESSFWDDVKQSFEKTFIREERWKLIVEGIGVTMLISLCAVVAGSLLGFGLYMLSRSDVKIVQKLTKAFAKGYSRIIAGTPVVVILMILFYVIFGSVRDMSGILVAIMGFTLTFGAFVYDHMTVSVNSVDRGQTEAAYALGYTKNKTFFRIIFPQAMRIFMPSYCGQAVELVKATAVVGYTAVNDLTKMGDIIRSNTYEAFFPLIATAVIYFLLTWGVSLLLRLVRLRFEPKRRSKESVLKGVKTV